MYLRAETQSHQARDCRSRPFRAVRNACHTTRRPSTRAPARSSRAIRLPTGRQRSVPGSKRSATPRLGKYRRRRPQTGAADAGILTTWRWRGYQDAPRIPITTSSALTACKRASRRLVVWARRPPSCRGCGARYAVDNESLYTYLLHPSSVPWMVLT